MGLSFNRRTLLRIAIYGSLALLLTHYGVRAYKGSGPYNGFDVSNIQIPIEQIKLGGPGRDGIPAIDEPKLIPAARADFMVDTDRVLGLRTASGPRAYPIRILNWHEIVNDQDGQQDLLVTWCPLCGTGAAFSPPPDSAGFGVSGLLYQSDLVLYDRASESLWTQVGARAISGPRAGRRLAPLPVEHTNWGDWRRRYPDSVVLSDDTGHLRDYQADPYAGYRDQNWLMFDVSRRDSRYPLKTLVLGFALDGEARVWPYPELARSTLPLLDRIAGTEIRVHYDGDNENAWIETVAGERLPGLTGFWFAWMAFHPHSSVYQRDTD